MLWHLKEATADKQKSVPDKNNKINSSGKGGYTKFPISSIPFYPEREIK